MKKAAMKRVMTDLGNASGLEAEGRTRADVDAEKELRFDTIAGRRVRGVLDALRRLGHCADRVRYKYSEEQVEKLSTAINEAVQVVLARFVGPAKVDDGFKF